MEAHLHSTLKIVPSSYQPNISVIAICSCRYIIQYIYGTLEVRISIHISSGQHTLRTDYSCIFTMKTVMKTNSNVKALSEVGLIPSTAHIVQEDRSNPTNKDAIIVHLIECYCICRLYNKTEVTVN